MHDSENELPRKKLCTRLAISGQHWTGLSTEKFTAFQFLGCLIKISVSVLHSSTESAKKPSIYGLLIPNVIYSSNNDKTFFSETAAILVSPKQIYHGLWLKTGLQY